MSEALRRFWLVALLVILTIARTAFKLRSASLFTAGLLPQEGALLVSARLVFGLPLALATFERVFAPGLLPWSLVSLHPALSLAGGIAACGGLGLIIAAHAALGSNFSTVVRIKLGQSLVTSGPYRLIRHPIYAGYLLFFSGGFLLSGSWLFGLSGGAIIALLVTVRLRKEEALLEASFGEAYRAYAARTGGLVPRLSLRALVRGGRVEGEALTEAGEIEAEEA